MSEHIVSSYEEQLKKLHSTVLKMGALCESQLANSIIALVKKDEELVDKIIGKDDRIDELEKKIDEQVVNLITLRQPMAIDLRETVSAMRIASELERIGDLKTLLDILTKLLTFVSLVVIKLEILELTADTLLLELRSLVSI